MINFLTILIILAWPFGQLLQLTPIGGSFRFQLIDLLTVLLSLSLLLSGSARRSILQSKLTKSFSILILSLSFSLLVAAFYLSPEILISALLYLLRFICYFSIYYSLSLNGLSKFSRYLLFSAVIFIALGLLQYIFLPDVRFLKGLGYDDHYFRLIGSFLDPNFTGLVLVIFTLVCLPKLIFLLPLLALVLTFSRASYLALAASLLYIGILTRHARLILVLVVLGAILYFVPKPFGEGVNLLRTYSIFSRIQNQVSALSTFIHQPLFGVGFNTLKSGGVNNVPNLSSGVDNSFLFILTTSGLLGFLSFLYFLKSSWNLNQNLVVHASFLAIGIHSLFNNSFFYSWILVLFFVLLNYSPKKST